MISGRRYPVELKQFDCGYDGDRATEGARQLVEDHGVDLLLMLGGDTLTPIIDYLSDRKILTSTLLPSDLSPDTPFLIAPSELHPIYNVTGVDWLARTRPELRTVAIAGNLPRGLWVCRNGRDEGNTIFCGFDRCRINRTADAGRKAGRAVLVHKLHTDGPRDDRICPCTKL